MLATSTRANNTAHCSFEGAQKVLLVYGFAGAVTVVEGEFELLFLFKSEVHFDFRLEFGVEIVLTHLFICMVNQEVSKIPITALFLSHEKQLHSVCCVL